MLTRASGTGVTTGAVVAVAPASTQPRSTQNFRESSEVKRVRTS